MTPPRAPGYFRGTELPRMLILAAVMLIGWVLVIQFARPRPAPPAPPRPTVAGPEIRPIVPDSGPEFAGVRDLTPMSIMDNAALQLLLKRTRTTPPEALASRARADLTYAHLWDRPARYRGVPVHLVGTALRAITYEVSPELAPGKRLYEAWIVTPDSQRLPYACVFEAPPNGFPIGSNLSEWVAFDGYFLKNLRYVAGDTTRGAPLLVGRLGWTAPRPDAPVGGDWPSGTVIGLAALILYAAVRGIFQIRRLFRPKPRARPSSEPGPVVGDVSAWLANIPDLDPPDQPRGGPTIRDGPAEE